MTRLSSMKELWVSFIVFTIIAVVFLPMGHDITAAGLTVQGALYSVVFFALGSFAHKVRWPLLYAFLVVLLAQAVSLLFIPILWRAYTP